MNPQTCSCLLSKGPGLASKHIMTHTLMPALVLCVSVCAFQMVAHSVCIETPHKCHLCYLGKEKSLEFINKRKTEQKRGRK